MFIIDKNEMDEYIPQKDHVFTWIINDDKCIDPHTGLRLNKNAVYGKSDSGFYTDFYPQYDTWNGFHSNMVNYFMIYKLGLKNKMVAESNCIPLSGVVAHEFLHQIMFKVNAAFPTWHPRYFIDNDGHMDFVNDNLGPTDFPRNMLCKGDLWPSDFSTYSLMGDFKNILPSCKESIQYLKMFLYLNMFHCTDLFHTMNYKVLTKLVEGINIYKTE